MSLRVDRNISIDYIMSSIDLAHEYAKLGKTGKANAIYHSTLSSIKNQTTLDEVRILFLLRHSESLAAVGNSLQRYASVPYDSAIFLPFHTAQASTVKPSPYRITLILTTKAYRLLSVCGCVSIALSAQLWLQRRLQGFRCLRSVLQMGSRGS
jgi:hypothetical protein